ncbi:DUF1997 domain-containing protein [Picosynechococcus sp. PCC 11901]|uniref:DUF1997 domain-containing protein n=1 Tax=Picosynechococcus sp. PCC 11901 TaxID=2579791 RepID=UPI0010FBE9CB|nr:DUF1997 domain-containing protein [Picosynechococcus sp. PCC 11901]QCS50135.1 DUF1997 domain-containing protein [Picosynechococcus sp. PCC 11901]
MAIRFQALEVVALSVPEAPRPIQEYLQDIDCLVGAIADPERTEKIAPDQYQLKMRPIGFLDLYKFQPIVTLKIWCDRHYQVHIKSLDYQLRGLEPFMKGFKLDVTGRLQPIADEQEQWLLEGEADLQVKLELPPPLWFTPKALVKKTGDRLLREILQRIKGQLLDQLVRDYQVWANGTRENSACGDRLETHS